ncbi:MAG: transposase, partial [Caldilineaceae bacterium SB0662_bin_9]|nr:transposase [Caldilineaceae bacterium SB0662_bin_9]
MAEKVTRVLHSQGLNAAKYDRLARTAVLCGQVRADAWRRCSGVSTAQQSPYEIRDAWMAEGYDWHGLPARLGKATLADALGDIQAGREAAKVPVKKAIRHRTRGNSV